MTFFKRIKSVFEGRFASTQPVVSKVGKGGNLVGSAYSSVAGNRPFFANAWRNIVKWVALFIGLAFFVFVEARLAKTIIDLNIFIIIVFAATIFYIILFSKWPIAAFALWIFISPWISVFGFSKPQSSIGLSFDILAMLLPIIILIMRLLVDKRKIQAPSFPEILFLAHAVYIRIPEWLGESASPLTIISFFTAFAAAPICVYFILKSCLRTRTHIIIFLAVLMGIGALWAIAGYYEHYTGYRWSSLIVQRDIDLALQDVAKGRATGPSGSYHVYGLVLNLAFALAAHFLGYTKHKFVKVICFVLMPMIAVGIFFGYSKGGYISFALFAILMFAMSRKNKAVYFSVAVITTIIVAVSYGSAMSDAKLRDRMDIVNSYRGRLAMHATALAMFKANPIFGVGYGNFSQNAAKYLSTGHNIRISRSGLARDYARPHSEYLSTLAEQGIVGFALYFGAIFFFILALIKTRKALAGKDDYMHDIISIILVYVVCILMIKGNDDFFKYPYTYYVFYSLLAVSARIYELMRANKLISADQELELVQGKS